MNEEERKKLNDIKEHCLKFTEFVDPHAIEKYKMFELLENKINELEKERKHLIDLQRNMDKQYEKLEQENQQLKDELKWYQLQCDDLEMELGDIYD